MEHFSTFSHYLRFGWAREFTTKDSGAPMFSYKKNRCEKLGDSLARPVLQPLDFSAKNSRNPLFIASLTITALFIATVIFYPAVVAHLITDLVGVAIKAVIFTLTQTTILGLCLRTLGRLNNPELMEEWDRGNLTPRGIGMVRI